MPRRSTLPPADPASTALPATPAASPAAPDQIRQAQERVVAIQAELIRREQAKLWKPFPPQGTQEKHPQQLAMESMADELYFGGSAGGGKSDLAIGLAVTAHQRTLFLRREAVQLIALVDRIKTICGERGKWCGSGHGGTMRIPQTPSSPERIVELAGCEHEDDKVKFQGRPHDLLVLDEAPHFLRSQYLFLLGWNRTTDKAQRVRALLTGNPPTTPEGRWVVEEFAPWLDEAFPDPAAPGTLRWYSHVNGKLTWLTSGQPFAHGSEMITPRSRTFIPSRVTDNPFLLETGYVATLQALPEPLRSQMLYGDMTAGTEDDPWQVIPTAWIRAAQARWKPDPPAGSTLDCIGVDPARGGACKTVISRRCGTWFDRLLKFPGSSTPDGQAVAALVAPLLKERQDCPVHLDAIGIGSSPVDFIRELPHASAVAVNVSVPTSRRDRAGVLGFANLRAFGYWNLREALDPIRGDNLALPPDPELLADLVAPKWELRMSGVTLLDKKSLSAKLGRSPDCGDSVVLAALPLHVWEAPGVIAAAHRAQPGQQEQRLQMDARMAKRGRSRGQGLFGGQGGR